MRDPHRIESNLVEEPPNRAEGRTAGKVIARWYRPAVFLLALATFGFRAWGAYEWDRSLNGPFCLSDELIYKQNAQTINDSTRPYSAQYPPGYPLLLSIALRFDSWYLAILLLNSLLAAWSVLLVCLLARRFLPPGWALAIAAVFALSPIHSVFPVMVLSENLAVPVLLGSVCAVVTLQRDSPAWRHTLFGALWLANWTVKFIGLVQLPSLALAWIFLAGRRGFLRISSGLSALAGGLLVLVLWLAFGLSHGLTPKQTLFGPFDVTTLALDPELLLSWLVLYGAYAFLAVGPLAPLVIRTFLTRASYGGIREAETRRDFRLLLFLFLSLAACLVFAAARHSTLALYNQPQPQYLLGRYLATVAPLGLLLGAVSLYAVRLRRRFHPAATAGALLLWLPAAWLAQSVLVEDRLGLGLSPHFAAVPFNTPELGALLTPGGRLLFLAIGAGSLVVVAAAARCRRWGQAATAAAVFGSACWVQLSSSPVAGKTWEMGSAGIHARLLAERLREIPRLADAALGVRIEPAVRAVQPPPRMVESLQFWGVTGNVAISKEPDCSLDTSQIRVEISLEARCSSPISYLANGQQVSVCIEEGDSKPGPCILDYGPRVAEAGTVFNPQANGYSGLWFRVRNVRPGTELLFNGMPLRPTVMRSDLATAALPPTAYPAPGTYPLQFRDPDTRVMSNTVFLDVK